ncbi:MAG TPA: amino-acid N-acetyltransferase [Crenotrichaceae bacterium]|nr:amino-acid N-acetyltransferase [Crenotrichaceae bacterium]
MQNQFVQWFRNSSPYIHAHRGTTIVISFGGDAVLNPYFYRHIHDFALLNSLGIRLVLVHGIRPQVDQKLAEQNIEPQFSHGLRITDLTALECVKAAAGHVKVELEALFTTSLSSSPMAGASIRVASGNVVIAKPYGVRKGVDFGYTGEVRRIDKQAIQQMLEQESVVLLSPIGYSVTGEVYNLSAESVATEVAIALQAEKLILMIPEDIQDPVSQQTIQQMTTIETGLFCNHYSEQLDPELHNHLRAAINASERGVQRTHLLNHNIDGAVLQELFSRDGIGTLISTTLYENLRTATLDDVGGILDLIMPLENEGILTSRSRESLETGIEDFIVLDRDGLVVGCVAAHQYLDNQMIELACLAIHPEYRNGGRAQRLLTHIENQALHCGMKRLVILTTHTSDWFREHGFESGTINDLPTQRQNEFNASRNSRVLFKNIATPSGRE